jgi:SPP1 family predicted phage head-tail adaptor
MADRQVASGARDKRITIQQLTESTGPSGFPVEDWTPLCELWAHREDRMGAERFGTGQLSAVGDVTWEIPYRSDIDPEALPVTKTRRVVHGGRIYDITSAVPVGRRRTIALTTIAKADV